MRRLTVGDCVAPVLHLSSMLARLLDSSVPREFVLELYTSPWRSCKGGGTLWLAFVLGTCAVMTGGCTCGKMRARSQHSSVEPPRCYKVS